MSNSNTIWWILLAGWMAGSTWWHVCKIKLICDAPLAENVKDVSPANEANFAPLHIMDGPALMLTSPGNILFNTSGSEPDVSKVQNELETLAKYLIDNPGRKLTLRGFYKSSETNNTQWPNLGVARAEEVKKYLVSKGVSAAQLSTIGELRDDLPTSGNIVSEAIAFEFLEQAEVNEKSLAEAQKFDDIFKSLDLYFPTGSADYIKTTDNEKFLLEAKNYLKDNKDKQLLLTGHTDNTGTVEGNIQLSKDRAEQVKAIFLKAGISADQLVTDSKGQSSPKATNNTEAGKAANRRVSIIVK